MATPLTLSRLHAEATFWHRQQARRAYLCRGLEAGVYDVVVAGAGLTGLTAAMHAQARGLRVAVIDQGEPGAGASGRNSGFVIPALGRAMPADVARAWGAARAERFNGALAGSANALFAFVRGLELDCGAQQCGWLQPDLIADDDVRLSFRAAELQAGGARVEVVGADELQVLTGSRRYRSALRFKEGGVIDPLALTRELASHFTVSGGTLAIGCRLLDIRDGGPGAATLQTTAGTLQARQIIMATNACGSDGARAMTRTTVPFSLLLAAFELPPGLDRKVLPGGMPLSDVGRDMWFFRRLPNGQVLTGMFPTRDRLLREEVEQMLCARFTAVFGVRPQTMTDLWGGRIGITRSGMPQLLHLGPNTFGWSGCNGRGIALSFLMGKMLGELVAGADAAGLAAPLQRAQAPFGRALQSWVGRQLVAADRRKRNAGITLEGKR